MTREEANKLKKDIISISDNPLFYMVTKDTILKIVLEKIDMITESEEEQEPCDKYIKEIDHLRRYISKLETQIVEQEPKTGHWKYNKCNMCGASRPPLFDNYCPNCGAYMKSENNDE